MDARSLAVLLAPFLDYGDDLAAKSKELVLGLLEHTAEPFSRHQFKPGHITGTAMVLHPRRESMLIVHHRRLDRWLLPGGHVENGDAAIWDTARREAIEETGVTLVAMEKPRLVGIDVHGIPAKRDEPYHLHHDLVFRFRALSEAVVETEETRGVKWCRPRDWDRYKIPVPAIRAFRRSQEE